MQLSSNDTSDLVCNVQPLVPQASNFLTTYPPAEYTHEELLQDPMLFYDALRKLHECLGTKYRVPTVAGQELDLHLLYKQVTAAGGLEAVIQGKKWIDACSPFNFPASFTSKSFTMRKIYSALLHHFEQVHFLRNTGYIVPPPGEQTYLDKFKRRRVDVAGLLPNMYLPVPPPAPVPVVEQHPTVPFVDVPVGTKVHGTVDSYFDCGYFVTINFGGEQFKGVLYQPPLNMFPAPRVQLPLSTGVKLHPDSNSQENMSLVKKPKVVKEILKPKQNKTPFNYFSVDARIKAKEAHPFADTKEISKIVGEMWAKATAEEKLSSIEMARKDRQRYLKELEEYKKKLVEQSNSEEALQALPLSPDMQQLSDGHHEGAVVFSRGMHAVTEATSGYQPESHPSEYSEQRFSSHTYVHKAFPCNATINPSANVHYDYVKYEEYEDRGDATEYNFDSEHEREVPVPARGVGHYCEHNGMHVELNISDLQGLPDMGYYPPSYSAMTCSNQYPPGYFTGAPCEVGSVVHQQYSNQATYMGQA